MFLHSDEVDKSYNQFVSAQNAIKGTRDSRSPPRGPKAGLSTSANGNSNGDAKNIPTGPRAQKKQKLNESHSSPSRSPVSLPLSISNSNPISAVGRSSRRDRSPRNGDGRDSPVKEPRMDEDEDVKKARDRSRERERQHERESIKDRERQREKDRGKDNRERERGRDSDRSKTKEKEREKDREHDRSRRNGRSAGSGGNRKGGRGNAIQDDRTLRQRMGL